MTGVGGTGAATRVTSVDAVRGLIILLMALDHTRDYIYYAADPLDLATTTVPLYLTRWITHVCAPVFMLLAGTGAFLQVSRGKTRRELSWFLVTRGLWLVVLELTVIRCAGWFWNLDYSLVLLIVIWALGVSMIVLAALIWIPRAILLAICLFAIVGHNALGSVDAAAHSSALWHILHVPGVVLANDSVVIVSGYVLIPWVFVMALGYATGPVFTWEPVRRQRALVIAGVGMIAAFIVLRATNLYGDPRPWAPQGDVVRTILDFLECEKYPPSLCYLLMTLGPTCLLLAAWERARGPVTRFFLVFGRVPLFFYLLHLPAIHLAAVLLALTRYDSVGFLFENPRGGPSFFPAPAGYGYALGLTYLVWLAVIAVLYPLCRWFAEYKRTHRAAWLSYL